MAKVRLEGAETPEEVTESTPTVMQQTSSAATGKESDCGSIAQSIARLPLKLTSEVTGLSKSDLRVLHKKQQWLSQYQPSLPDGKEHLRGTMNATLVFAQEEAGTAVCISWDGLLLTCSHCLAETEEDLQSKTSQWLLFSSGRAVKTSCIAWDQRRDLALLRIVAAQPPARGLAGEADRFPSVSLATAAPSLRDDLICIGHPGSEDLENVVPGIQTNYDVLYVSEGRFRGYAKGQDLHDNSDIGALKHDCWTYWGHSGAPLIDQKSGCLVGLHSSWDDQTGMRRGIAWETVKQFLEESVLRRH